jgi:3-methylcrotonyl-CoA carboxylase alpha subunit
MEMNTRLQVEHPVTEAITGLDLVEWQLRVAAGETLPRKQSELKIDGHAIEARLYAEDPNKGFLPSVGRLERLRLPDGDGIRVDSGVREGDEVSVFYDPMIAKVIAHAETREAAAARLAHALAASEVAGVHANAGFLVRALRQPDFLSGDIDTGFIERHREALIPVQAAPRVEILARAALYLVEARAKASVGCDPWNAQDGFRLSGEAREIAEFAVEGKRIAVEILHRRGGGLEMSIAGKSVTPAHASVMRLASGDIAVMEAGDTWTLALHDPFAEAEGRGTASDRIVAPMPGKIVQLLVRPGESVKRGQPLAVLEAMKMEHTLAAPADALVASVDAAAGDQVGEGAVIVRFAKEKSAAA